MRIRLLVVVVATTGLVVIAFAVPLGALVRSVARDRAITNAERDSAALAPVLALVDDAALIQSAMERTVTGNDGRLTVVLPDGTRLGDDSAINRASLALARQRQTAFSEHLDSGLALYSPVVTGDGDVIVIRARLPDELLDDGVVPAWTALAGVAVALVVAAAFVADRLARSLTIDAAAVAATARELASGRSAARVEPGSTRELADVGRALNLLADRIDELRAAERERVADLSHRLRTPLTALRLDAEAGRAADVVAGVDRLEAAVTDLVSAARRPLHESPVALTCDLAAVARDRVRFWAALADDDDRPWTSDIPDGAVLPVRLGDDEAAAAIDAIVGNVFSHTPDGVAYAITATTTGGWSAVVVDDAGPGISDPDVLLARGATGAGSTGLGLDIARGAAAAAGGDLAIESSPLGGLRVTLRFPIA